MVMNDATTAKLLDLMAEIRSKKLSKQKQYESEIAKLDSDIQSIQRTLDLLLPDNTISEQNNSNLQLDLSNDEVNAILKAPNHSEAAKVIAKKLDNHTANVTKTADILIRVGRATGKRRNLISSLYDAMKNGEDWEYVSPGYFRLKESHPQQTDIFDNNP